MKKLLTFAIALVLVFAICVPFISLADNGASFVIDDISGVKPGDEFTAVLKVSGNYELHTANISVSYDTAALTIVNVEKGKFITDKVMSGSCVFIEDHEAVPGSIKMGILMPIEALSGEGELLKMTFKVNAGVTVNQQLIIVVSELGYLPTGQTISTPVAFTTDNSVIIISGGSAPADGYNPGETGTGEYRPDTIVTIAPSGEPATPAPNSGKVTIPDTSTAAPSETDAQPDNQIGAAATRIPEASTAPAKNGSPTPRLLIILLCVLAAVVIVIIIFIVVSGNKKKHNSENAGGGSRDDENSGK